MLKKILNAPLALCAMGVLTLVLLGCEKASEPVPAKPAEPPANAPEVYMKDPAFRKAMDEKVAELKAILKERAPLEARMKELVREYKNDLAKLQQVPEWGKLHQQIVALNEKYESVRQRQLKIVGERIRPQEISK